MVLAAVAAQEIPPAVNVFHVTKEPSVNPQAGGERGEGHRRGRGCCGVLWPPWWVSPPPRGY